MPKSPFLKAIVAAVVAGATALVAALSDNSVSAQEVGGIVTALLAGGGFTYVAPNTPPARA